MACVNFLSGYFQLRLDKGSQPLTVFNTEFGRYLFLRAPQGLSSSGDAFNANTDRFYSGLGKHLLKQVDDIYIQAVSMDDLDGKLRVAAKEAMDAHGASQNSLLPGCVILYLGLELFSIHPASTP